MLEWVSPYNHMATYDDIVKKRQDGTGQWLLNSDEYATWKSTKKRTLFCPGIPGAGKTILSSIVISDLHHKSDKFFGVGYLYCQDFGGNHERTPEKLLGSLLKQLSQQQQQQQRVPEAVQKLYNEYQRDGKKTGGRPSLDEMSQALESVAACYSKVFFVIDALDECGCRDMLLHHIFDLQARCGANVFATSRHVPAIAGEIERRGGAHGGFFSKLEIRANDKDIQTFLAHRMPQQLPLCARNDGDLQKKIGATILESVGGMFLLAQLYFNLLEDKLRKRDIEDALQAFQQWAPDRQSTSSGDYQEALGHAYDGTMRRIKSQKYGKVSLVMKVLGWIAHAERPLTETELLHALAIQTGTRKLNHLDDLYLIEDVVSVCAGLFIRDEESQLVRLVHATARAYFNQTESANQTEMRMQGSGRTAFVFPRNPQVDITMACATYLSFDVFGSGACQSNDELVKRLESHPFYSYAAHHWGHHARKAADCSDPPGTVVLDLLTCEAKVEAATQALMVDVSRLGGVWHSCASFPKRTTGLHLAALFGAEQVVTALMRRRDMVLNATNEYGSTLLSYAVEHGHAAAVDLILQKSGGRVTAGSDQSLLHLAIAGDTETWSECCSSTPTVTLRPDSPVP